VCAFSGKTSIACHGYSAPELCGPQFKVAVAHTGANQQSLAMNGRLKHQNQEDCEIVIFHVKNPPG
jgi:hypothetical protein